MSRQPGKAVSGAEVGAVAGSLLEDACDQVGGDTDVHRAAVAIGHDIGSSAFSFAIHGWWMLKAGPRVKPGVTRVSRGGRDREGRVARALNLAPSATPPRVRAQSVGGSPAGGVSTTAGGATTGIS